MSRRQSKKFNEEQQEDAAAQQAAYQQGIADSQVAPAPAAGAPDPIAQLTQLGQLHQQGVLTDAEFAAQKAKILG